MTRRTLSRWTLLIGVSGMLISIFEPQAGGYIMLIALAFTILLLMEGK